MADQFEPKYGPLAHFDGMLSALSAEIHKRNQKWWVDLNTGEPKERNVGEMIALTHTELSEGLEGYRKQRMDDHLPHRPMIEVELADCIIRCLDMGAGMKLDIAGALVEKLIYNETRADHSLEERRKPGGKKI